MFCYATLDKCIGSHIHINFVLLVHVTLYIKLVNFDKFECDELKHCLEGDESLQVVTISMLSRFENS